MGWLGDEEREKDEEVSKLQSKEPSFQSKTLSNAPYFFNSSLNALCCAAESSEASLLLSSLASVDRAKSFSSEQHLSLHLAKGVFHAGILQISNT